jgi:protein-tyrosine phosphatase
MIDLHTHVLPHVDDGAATPEESRRMLRRWSELGFDRVVATPHLFGSEPPEYRVAIDAGHTAIAPEVGALMVAVERGFEIMLDPGIPDRLSAGEPLTLAGSRSVLVELPFSQWPAFTEETLFAIQLAGFQPVLAHPERYDAVQANPRLALELAGRGVVLQITYASLAGTLGRGPRRTAELLLASDGPQVLASDAHSAGQRLAAIPDGLERAIAIVGTERVGQLTEAIPRALLADEALPEPAAPMPAQPAETGALGRLRRVLRAS